MNTVTNNFNKLNTQQQPSFQATFKTEIPIANLERLEKIQKIFAEKTKHYKGDILTLSKSLDSSFEGYSILRITDKVSCGDYQYCHLAPNIDELMHTMTDNQIAKKLIRYFQMLKKEEKMNKVMDRFNEKITHLKGVKLNNLSISEATAKAGKKDISAQFRILANSNQKRLEALIAEQNMVSDKLINDMEKIAKDEPDLDFVPNIYRNPNE